MALRIVLIEDEPATARNLKFLLQETDPAIEVITMLTGIADSVEWLGKNTGNYDLIFSDIRLNDGLSFEIFDKLTIEVPVIFVTAYNDYALQAFKTNGIDYILKPFDDKELTQALAKFKRLAGNPPPADDSYARLQKLAESLKGNTAVYKQSFLVHFRDKMIPLTVKEIAWFYTTNEIVQAQTTDNKNFAIDFTMEQLQNQLDPTLFFRVNRQFIVHRSAIREVVFYFNGRLLVKTAPESNEKMLISKARVPEFKAWMNT
ncbi:MAG TPA: LytTR family DNA-binding domain-containing protein [Puia sp.]|nr:LytTR family DNA-binding domain-containing protein [Puia sp.]